jgi:hypothetical protein
MEGAMFIDPAASTMSRCHAGAMNITFKADISRCVATRPSVLVAIHQASAA